MKAKRAARRSTTLRVANARTGELHRIRISAPQRFFGRWIVTQTSKPRRVAHARAFCRGGRVFFKWDKGAGDAETMRAMIFAVNRAVDALSGQAKAAIGGVCRLR